MQQIGVHNIPVYSKFYSISPSFIYISVRFRNFRLGSILFTFNVCGEAGVTWMDWEWNKKLSGSAVLLCMALVIVPLIVIFGRLWRRLVNSFQWMVMLITSSGIYSCLFTLRNTLIKVWFHFVSLPERFNMLLPCVEDICILQFFKN